MERTWSTELGRHAGERVRLAGWLQRFRQLSQVSFLVLRDARGLAQVVVEDPELVAQLARLQHESVLYVEGVVVAPPQAPGGVELHQPTVEVISAASEPPPFDLFRPTIAAQLPTILDHAPLALRHPRHRAFFALSAALLSGFRSTLHAMDFVEIQTPKLVAAATEGGANVFAVDYFGREAYLAQSPQLYKQVMVGVFERVYETGPAFRAEPHDTGRHLAEYVSLDAELGFIDDHFTVMRIAREALAGMIEAVRSRAPGAASLLGVRLPDVPSPIPAIDFVRAQQQIEEATGAKVVGEPDLAPADERWIGEWARREHGSDFVFVVGYPMEKRPFYTHPDLARPTHSLSFDLIFRGLEVIAGGQRLHLYDDYVTALAARGLSQEPFEGYLQAFRHAMPPHGGFAIGLERWVAQLVGAANVRETTLFPRDRSRLAP
ncbi:MAG: aspartate--tRNA(Asn) ligase [Actinomycetota bacterium]|nr:aspartate--tRNA(Asn) ligase [Actinomycetota bacterium]